MMQSLIEDRTASYSSDSIGVDLIYTPTNPVWSFSATKLASFPKLA